MGIFQSPAAYLEYLQNRELTFEQKSAHEPEGESKDFDYQTDESSAQDMDYELNMKREKDSDDLNNYLVIIIK